MAIQRINYHTGLFLEEAEFKIEQNYHMLMRRRINYALFTPGVVYGLGLNYNSDGDGKLFVQPGMAIDEFTDGEPESPSYGEILGREIIVTSNHDATDKLSGLSGTVWITVNYTEAEKDDDAKPPTELPARTTEFFNIEVHTNDPGVGTEKILLGSIEIGTPSAVEAAQKATLRLGGAAPVALVSIAITPASPTIQVGGTVQLTARGTRSDNSTIDLTNTATWTSSDDSIATVGSQGLVNGVTEGPAAIAITAESQGISGTAIVTVSAVVPTLVSIKVSPDPTTVNVGETIQLTAIGTYSDNSTSDLTSNATWASSDDTVATVNASGLVTGVAIDDPVTITATDNTITGTTTVQVQSAAEQPVIDFLSPDRQISLQTIDVHGINIRDTILSSGDPATGTTIRFMKGVDTKEGLNLLVRPDAAGRQVVRVTVPDRSGTPWGPKEEVSLELTFNGLTATKPFRYDD